MPARFALEAPMVALFLAAFAENKVEGIAYGKMIGVIYVSPFIAYFVDSKWHYLAGFLPPFWVTKAFLAAQAEVAVYWVFVAVGVVVHIGAIALLIKRFADKQR